MSIPNKYRPRDNVLPTVKRHDSKCTCNDCMEAVREAILFQIALMDARNR